jgi:hypothetical protein
MELKSYVCPNCGANTTNAQNCEYCGSLLVRFVEKGIDLSHTSYLNDNAVFPGLVEELKRNLKLQSENPKVAVATDLNKKVDNRYESLCIMSGLSWQDGTVSPEFDGSKKGLCIANNFSTYMDVANNKEFNDEMDAQLARFRQLDSFPLFTAHICTYEDNYGYSRYGRVYAINFGEDAEGAARLVSEILIKVNGWSPTEPYDMFTNVGNNINRARETWKAAHGFGTVSNFESTDSGEDSGLSNIIGWVVGIIIWIVLTFIGC